MDGWKKWPNPSAPSDFFTIAKDKRGLAFPVKITSPLSIVKSCCYCMDQYSGNFTQWSLYSEDDSRGTAHTKRQRTDTIGRVFSSENGKKKKKKKIDVETEEGRNKREAFQKHF
ncbi:hypothetical protein NL108_011632 [Boleophthalmus pectinirostris]|nr:hypothetical protein NL108_011632 [Boleophthalmus pectinirostris]